MKNRALLTFLDKGDGFMRQLKCLEYCWKNTGIIEDTDLIVFCLPELIQFVSKDCIAVPFEPYFSKKLNYEFLNCVEIFDDPSSEFIKNYKNVMRTDLDIFLAPNFKNWYADEKFYCGYGSYWNDTNVKENIQKVCSRLSLNHFGYKNIGSTWYSDGKTIHEVGSLTLTINKYLLENYFVERHFNWPNWTYGVSLLYASEIAINHLVGHNINFSDRLDQHSDVDMPLNDAYHIHCWHTEKTFSKFAWMNNKYKNVDVNSLDDTKLIDYCLKCAINSERKT